MNTALAIPEIAIIAVVVAIITFLATHLMASKSKAFLENQLRSSLENLEKLTANDVILRDKNTELDNRHRSLDIAHNRLDTRHQSQFADLQSARQQLANSQLRLEEISDQRHQAEKSAESLSGLLQENQQQQQTQKHEFNERLTALQTQQQQLQSTYNQCLSDYTELRTTLSEREKSHRQQLAQFSEHKHALTQEFENLANKIFEEKGKTFTTASKNSIDMLLQPFRQQIDGFQQRINDIHDQSLQGHTTLNAEIRKVLDVGLKMSDEASNLTSALKGDSQQRGAWGEAQLQRTLEMSGLIEDAHYEKQSAFKDRDGKSKQTDYLITLPDNKHIIIDSKVSLIAYDRAISAANHDEYVVAMAEHVKAIKRHIDDLAAKDYTNLVGVRSPSFVLMFMPIEPAYIEALKSNKDLFTYGYDKNIVLVSHTTLIPILRTVANLWMMERSNAEAREISEKAGEIYNQVCMVAERLHKMGGTLSSLSNHYNSTVKALVGQQGLHGKVERFNQLSSKVSKTMPALEASHLDIETERLSLIVEPLSDAPEEDGSPSSSVSSTSAPNNISPS